jgi:pimeloyl-ACP methyl ester carboxylesterase
VALPGRGGVPSPGTLGATVDLLAGVLERLPGPRALIGQDLGAALALSLAAARPDLVDGVVALGCGATLPMPPAALAAAAADPGAAAAALLGGVPAPAAGAAMLAATEGPALAADLAMCATADPAGVAPGVRCPVLAVAGEDDPWTPPAAVEALARALPSCALVLVPRAGHLVQADAGGTVNLLLAAYLARLELTLAEG